MIFSVADVSVFEVFHWRMFVIFYSIAAALIAFPRLSKVWPLSTFSFLKERGRWNGLVAFLFVSVIAVPHYFMTALPLRAEKAALASGDFEVVEAFFDGQRPDKQVAWATFPETSLSFEGDVYEVPGTLHGSIKLLPEIRSKLKPNTLYRLFLFERVILKIEAI